jgi:hypothetical protein
MGWTGTTSNVRQKRTAGRESGHIWLTFAVSLAFVLALLTGHWGDAGGIAQ